MQIEWMVENDPYCQKVLAKHWPNVTQYGDIREVDFERIESVDLVAGGFPCQDVSIAGKRAGLAGEQSGLWHEFIRILDRLKPQWAIVENVFGLLSSNAGQDFATILHGLVGCGYGVCWRVLDAQYFGVAQRRRRVFIVGSLGDGRAATILFESEKGVGISHDTSQHTVANTLTTRYSTRWNDEETIVEDAGGLRWLTPTECERLQGFPDNWTSGSDTARYRALGNAVCVPVVQWLGERIVAAEASRGE